MEQYYNIAGLVVRMDSFGRTVEQAKPYLCPPCENVDIQIVSKWKTVKPNFPTLSDDDGEYLATGFNFYYQLLNYQGMMLHSSAVVVDGRAYLFSANPGVGKSTHTTLWLDSFGDRAYILNDDKPALRREKGVWYAYGTPWSGKHDLSVNVRVPVAGIAMLERGETNEILPFAGEKAISAVLKQLCRPKDMDLRIKLLSLLDKLMTEVPIWQLKCNRDPEAVIVSYEAMSGKKMEK